MADNLINHHSCISIGGREIYNIRLADDIDRISGSNDELQQLINSLSKHASDYGMEISSEKSKTIVNSRDESLNENIRMDGEILGEVDKFKNLEATITKDGTSETEIRIRLATYTSALIRLKTIWTSTKISFKTKFSL